MKQILKEVKKVLLSNGIEKTEVKKILSVIELTILKMVQNKESSDYITETVVEIMESIIKEHKLKEGNTMNKEEETIQVNDEEITYYKDKGEKFFQVNKDIVVKRYFLPATEFTNGVKKGEGFCFTLCTKKDEKRFLKIAERQNLEVFRVDMLFLDDFVKEEMESCKIMNFSDTKKPLNILSKKCKARGDALKKKSKKGA